ncbi:MAG: uroporphyrinogen decarboxylase family protein [Promethearchaeota archaeon]
MTQDSMAPEERVWTALNHEEPDRVPIYEGVIEPAPLNRGKKPMTFQPGILFYGADVLRYLTAPWARPAVKLYARALRHPHLLAPAMNAGIKSATALHRCMGVDLMGFVGGIFKVLDEERLFRDFRTTRNRERVTVTTPGGEVATQIPRGGGAALRNGFLRSPSDYEKYVLFDPDHPANYALTRKALEVTRGKIALAFTVFGAAYFEAMCEMFGFEGVFKFLLKEPKFVERIVKDMSDYACATAEHLLERGVRLFYMSDDLGQIGRPLISPRMYRRFFAPGVKKFCRLVHRHGGKVMMHSCGNVLDLLPDIVDTGIDALHPWEPTSGMDIFAGKREWGDRITLVGNVPIQLLTDGTTGEVVDYVDRLLREVAPGGGYVIASAHSIVSTCKWRNYGAMLWAARKHGKYPIS